MPKEKHILVAGGAGYIGSHFCYLAAGRGYTPVVVDRLASPHPHIESFRTNAVRWGPLEIADIGDSEKIAGIVEKYRPLAAVGFAALIEVGESVAKPDLYWDNNYARAIRFFKTLHAHGVDKIVFSSTAAVYGNPAAEGPLREDDMLAPINPYGASKLATECALHGIAGKTLAAHFSRALAAHGGEELHGLKSMVFRYFNAAGAAPDQGLGEMHEPETHLVPNAILAAHRLRGFGAGRRFTLNGMDYPTPDGTCIRDYVHVMDLAEAHLAGLDYLLQGGENETINLGSGHGYSVQQVIDTVKRTSGHDFDIHVGPRRDGDPAMLVADITKARRLLGWSPRHDLAAIIESANRFHTAMNL